MPVITATMIFMKDFVQNSMRDYQPLIKGDNDKIKFISDELFLNLKMYFWSQGTGIDMLF